jgi:hypothetical protein
MACSMPQGASADGFSHISPLEVYRQRFAGVHGFFMAEAIAIWDFLLTAQRNNSVNGNFFEIGVLEGKSAGLGAAHLVDDELCILIDINEIPQVAQSLREMSVKAVVKAGRRSDDPTVANELREYEGTVRWFHIDGAHDGYTTTADLRLAGRFLANRGIICVDDFLSPRYPQLTAAVYRFLFDNPIYRMFLCGMNKAYIARAADYAFYEGILRHGLPKHLKESGYAVTLAKTSYAHDDGCFAVIERVSDFDIYGRDEDPADVPL